MNSDETSCSDCKLEIVEQRWTQLLLNWINKCVRPKSPVSRLNMRSLVEVVNKYKQDICCDDIDKAILSSDDIEPFIKYKYPILRLRAITPQTDTSDLFKRRDLKEKLSLHRFFWEIKDMPKKIYILNTIMLFHCCVSSIDGHVDSDICINLEKHEQEMILKFCERLTDMEVTVNNIESAIRDACEAVKYGPKTIKKPELDHRTTKVKSSNNQTSNQTSNQTTSQATSQATRKASQETSKSSEATVPSTTPNVSGVTLKESMLKKFNALKFKSSVTVLPSAVTEASSYSEVDSVVNYDNVHEKVIVPTPQIQLNVEEQKKNKKDIKIVAAEYDSDQNRRCLPLCACSRCSPTGPCCGDPGTSNTKCAQDDYLNDKYDDDNDDYIPLPKRRRKFKNILRFKKFYLVIVILLLILIAAVLLSMFIPWRPEKKKPRKTTYAHIEEFRMSEVNEPRARTFQHNSYICLKGLCQKVFEPTSDPIFLSLSRCTLQCMGPQLWPFPIGYTYFSKKIVTLATNRLEYKFQSVPSEAVHLYLAEAFKLFLGDLAKLERYNIVPRKENLTRDMLIKKMYIEMDIETDPDPRIRLDTEESYTIKVETINNQVTMKLLAASFCGMRHALETLSQLILLDQTTGYLITLSNIIIKDAPSYKYRGLMIDTGRNYIPVPDIMRTIDAMATCKLNTFHWRISDVTSFPLHLPAVPQLFEYGAYDRSLIYTKEDVKAVVKRAGIRGIRVLLEVAAPGPVGRAWSWVPEASCPTKNKNFTCNNVLCLRLAIQDSIFDILQIIYSEILDMTKIEDVFHLSDSVFSLSSCYYLIEEREGFLDKALERLKLANKGFLPKLPIIWYTTHLTRDFEARTWDRYGVQLTEWQPNPSDQFLSRYKVIHSSRWDLSCEVKKQRCRKYRTWQDMYSWKSWRNIEVFTIEGGEALLWTDLVDRGNLDYHLWPRAAAVAERLWSDVALNGSVTGAVYVRLDSHRWRMVMKSVQVQPIWPLFCSFSPGVCLEQLRHKQK